VAINAGCGQGRYRSVGRSLRILPTVPQPTSVDFIPQITFHIPHSAFPQITIVPKNGQMQKCNYDTVATPFLHAGSTGTSDTVWSNVIPETYGGRCQEDSSNLTDAYAILSNTENRSCKTSKN